MAETHEKLVPPNAPFVFYRDPKFAGREDTTESLDEDYKTYRRIAIIGRACIGYSQIAIEYLCLPDAEARSHQNILGSWRPRRWFPEKLSAISLES